MSLKSKKLGPIHSNHQLPRYVYGRLKTWGHIRLIHLEPAIDPNARILLSLSQHKLEDAPAYDALSYTWGDPSNVRDITIFPPVVEGDSQSYRHLLSRFEFRGSDVWKPIPSKQHDTSTTLSVTYNCFSALRRLRYPTTPPDSSPTSDAAIDFMVHYHQSRRAGKFSDHVYDMTEGFHVRDMISEFYARLWFSRIWVLQEVYMGAQEHSARAGKGPSRLRLPPLLHCGDRSVEWSGIQPLHIDVDCRPAEGSENE
ncbi:hypothetical protein B0T20DRAFT_487204 [Sordaria brevicollis]|uniref:Heterokaryon incompatibility domain-containing protein n=1 Tax=Sordaria brevicollis TaxID=83679 RepID=A0AAE0U9D2_SORBR|nr:hypothetical protein B0T20DRAFT_487204 [Sordaria brevicollis]